MQGYINSSYVSNEKKKNMRQFHHHALEKGSREKNSTNYANDIEVFGFGTKLLDRKTVYFKFLYITFQ